MITEYAVIDGVPVLGPGIDGGRYRGVMSIPGAFRASTLISDLIGQVPWDAYRDKDGFDEKWKPRPPLLEQPSPPEPRMNTIASLALDLVCDGNAIGIIAARDSYGYPTAIYPVPASMVGVRRITDNTFSPLPIGTIEYSIGSLRELTPDDVIHIKGPHEPGALRGMGVLEAHFEGVLSLAKEQLKQASDIANNGVPTGLLRSTNPDDGTVELAAMKAQWMVNQRRRTIQAINSATEFTPLSWNPEDLELVDSRKFTLHEIALVFGLPLSFLGADQSSRTYSNIEQDAINLLKFTLGGHLARFEQTLSLFFPRGTQVRADLDAILRPDTLARYQGYQLGVSGKWLEVNEVRSKERLKPLPESKINPPAPALEGNQDGTDQQPQDGQPASDPGAQPVRRPVNGRRPAAVGADRR